MFYEAAIYVAILLLGLVVVFYCVCILCDEHLVPTIEVFIEQFQVPEEVAAVTLVAFGSACPEIVLNTIGAVEGKSSLSLPACLGSAIIAFGLIPALCVLCNGEADADAERSGGEDVHDAKDADAALVDGTMELKTLPVLREALFYCIALVVFLAAFANGSVSAGEAAMLVCVYFVYVGLVVGLHFRQRWTGKAGVGSGVGPSSPHCPSPRSHAHHKHHEQGASLLLRVHSPPSSPALHCSSAVRGAVRFDKAAEASAFATAGDEESAADDISSRGAVAVTAAAAPKGSSPAASSSLSMSPGTAPVRVALLHAYASARGVLDLAVGIPIHDAMGFIIPKLHPETQPQSTSHRSPTLAPAPVPLWRALLVLVVCIGGVGVLSSCIIVLCSEFTAVMGLSSGTIGATIVALGSEIPDTVQSVTLARNGYHEAAMAGAIGSQVINLSLGGGLPLLFLSLSQPSGEFEMSRESTASLWLLASLLLCLICAHVGLILPLRRMILRAADEVRRLTTMAGQEEKQALVEEGQGQEGQLDIPVPASAAVMTARSCLTAFSTAAAAFEYTQFTRVGAQWLLAAWAVVFVAFVALNEDVV